MHSLTTAKLDDEALMRRVQANDHAAFAELYDRHAVQAFSVARSVCRDTRRAEDAVQEGFLSVWRSRARYRRGQGSVRAWTMMIVRNRAIDSYRNVSARPQEVAHPVDGEISDTVSSSPSDEVIARAESDTLRTAVSSLPEPQAEAITLAFYGGLSHSEIAAQLELPPGTVKGRMRLGLEKLRTLIDDEGSRVQPDSSEPRLPRAHATD
jgi:RNA polymerase sigma-70 factor (ECF subfamily)